MTLYQAKEKLAQAYVVLGVIIHGSSDEYSSNDLERALDYFSDSDWFDPGFLPWGRRHD
jgi:hypothetical protein